MVIRLYPPVPLTFRQALVDDQIGEYFIPEGTAIAILPPYRYTISLKSLASKIGSIANFTNLPDKINTSINGLE